MTEPRDDQDAAAQRVKIDAPVRQKAASTGSTGENCRSRRHFLPLESLFERIIRPEIFRGTLGK